MARPPIYTLWTPEHYERLTQLAAQGASVLRAAAPLSRPPNSVRSRARKLGLSLMGVRKARQKLASSLKGEGRHV